MNFTAFILALAVATPPIPSPQLPTLPPRALTPGEARIHESYSKCIKKLNVCRFDRNAAKGDARLSREQLEEKLLEPPPKPKSEIPVWFWLIAGAAVAAAGTGGVVLGYELAK